MPSFSSVEIVDDDGHWQSKVERQGETEKDREIDRETDRERQRDRGTEGQRDK